MSEQLPTIDEVKALQARMRITDHVVYLGEDGFVLAHTDPERESGMDLETCELHQWLSENADGPPAEPGRYYRVTRHQADAVSESYRGGQGPWDFDTLEQGPPPVARSHFVDAIEPMVGQQDAVAAASDPELRLALQDRIRDDWTQGHAVRGRALSTLRRAIAYGVEGDQA